MLSILTFRLASTALECLAKRKNIVKRQKHENTGSVFAFCMFLMHHAEHFTIRTAYDAAEKMKMDLTNLFSLIIPEMNMKWGIEGARETQKKTQL